MRPLLCATLLLMVPAGCDAQLGDEPPSEVSQPTAGGKADGVLDDGGVDPVSADEHAYLAFTDALAAFDAEVTRQLALPPARQRLGDVNVSRLLERSQTVMDTVAVHGHRLFDIEVQSQLVGVPQAWLGDPPGVLLEASARRAWLLIDFVAHDYVGTLHDSYVDAMELFDRCASGFGLLPVDMAFTGYLTETPRLEELSEAEQRWFDRWMDRLTMLMDAAETIEGANPVPYCPSIYDHDGPGGLAVGAEPCLGAVMTRMITIAVDALLMGLRHDELLLGIDERIAQGPTAQLAAADAAVRPLLDKVLEAHGGQSSIGIRAQKVLDHLDNGLGLHLVDPSYEILRD